MKSTVNAILRERFGFARLRPIQRDVITRIMDGGDALVVMPTGSGKSLCYQLPALALPEPGVTLVFSPLIALMEDQVAALKAKGINAAYINSTIGKRERESRQRRLAEGEFDLIYATPERMQKPEFVEAINATPGGVKLLAIDEAHCISKWGHDLRPAYQRVGRFRKELGSPTTIALTATATASVRKDIRRTLGLRDAAMPLFSTPVDRPNLTFETVEVWGDDDKLEKIREIATQRGRAKKGVGIIYCARITDMDHLVAELRPTIDRPIEIYHGQLTPARKKQVYERFIEAEPDEGLLLFATNAFGMGVDKADIRFIIHAQLPASVEAYYQEVGRAGRDGKASRCVLLYDPNDLAIQQTFTEWANPSADFLVRVADVLERHPEDRLDVDEIQLQVSGKARTAPRGRIEYALIALEKRGVAASSRRGRWNFVRPLRYADLDEKAIERKRKHDLKRLLEIVKLAQAEDLRAFIQDYFELDGRTGSKVRIKIRRKVKTSRRGRGGRGRKKKVDGRAPAEKRVETDGTKKKRRRRRRRRPAAEGAAQAQAQATAANKAPAEGEGPKKKRRRRRRRRKPAAE